MRKGLKNKLLVFQILVIPIKVPARELAEEGMPQSHEAISATAHPKRS